MFPLCDTFTSRCVSVSPHSSSLHVCLSYNVLIIRSRLHFSSAARKFPCATCSGWKKKRRRNNRSEKRDETLVGSFPSRLINRSSEKQKSETSTTAQKPNHIHQHTQTHQLQLLLPSRLRLYSPAFVGVHIRVGVGRFLAVHVGQLSEARPEVG